MRKFFKWIFLGFLFLLFLGIGIGAYFYFLPTYPDYGISEEYFNTRFHEQAFENVDNAYPQWREFIENLDRETQILPEIDRYSKCYVQADCQGDLTALNASERKAYLDSFLESNEYSLTFGDLRDETLSTLESITNQSYINTHDYEDYKKLLTGGETKSVITFTKLIQFSRSLLLYYSNSSRKETISVFRSYYKSLTKLSNKIDSGIIEYLVIITILGPQLDYFIENIDNFNKLEKTILKNILEQSEISNSMIENGLKAEYQNSKILFEILDSDQNLNGNEKSTGIRKILFYQHKDTINLLKKTYYDAIENKTVFDISKNGRNYIGRLMLDIGQATYISQFQKQNELLNKREQLIQLLSN